MLGVSDNTYLPYRVECVRCNDNLIAPHRSKFVTERHVRHSWSCDSCGHRFETSHHLHFSAHPSEPSFA
jgi:hypothetical protein